MYRIMIVEDDEALCLQLMEGLKKWSFDVVVAKDFESIMEDFAVYKPQLVIMDVNLPCFDGYFWCRRIREISKVPVLFLSSRDANMDIIMAVNTGADDYITKPFSMSVLIAKIQAILRRTYDYGAGNTEILEHKGIMVNTGESVLIYNNEKVELTRNELKIITMLLNNNGRIVSRESIMQLLWDNDMYVNENTLTVNINRLRSKLADVGLTDIISTKKGQGYMIL